MKKFVIAIVIALLLTGGAGLLWSRMGNDDPTDPDELLLSGNIEAHESLLSFQQVQARIVQLPVEEGQFVKAGTLLAAVDDSVYRQQVAIAEAALKADQAQLLSAEQSLVAAQASVQSSQADLAQRKLDQDHYQTLWDQQVASKNSLDLAQTAYKQSNASVSRSQALLDAATENVKVARDNVDRAQQDLKMAQITQAYTVLYAPFSGVVVTRDTELGEVMLPGAPVVTLADLDHVWLRAYINETDFGRVRWGESAVVTTDSYPGSNFHGHISFISSEAEFTPKSVETHAERVTLVYRIKIDLDNPDYALKPGMPADAKIELAPLIAEQVQR
jgi:HlyD family secretion protein